MKLKKQDLHEIIENALSWVVVMGMLLYGFGKFVQFDGGLGIDKRVSEMSGMELMWAFYGYSKPFALVLGFFEVLGGALMLFPKSRIFGCFVVSTILVNVILQDIFYQVNIGALKAAIVYQSIVFIVLIMRREQVIAAVKILWKRTGAPSPIGFKIFKLAIALAVFLLLRILEWYVTIGL